MSRRKTPLPRRGGRIKKREGTREVIKMGPFILLLMPSFTKLSRSESESEEEFEEDKSSSLPYADARENEVLFAFN